MPDDHARARDPAPTRILFVFAWLVVGGKETELRLLARLLAGIDDGRRYPLDVLPCFRKDGMPELTHAQLAALGIHVDTIAYSLSFEDTVAYLARRLPGYDFVVSCQNVADIYPALERLGHRPLLIEHGGLVSEALAGPKHFTARYVGVCRSIRDAAASRMPDRPQHAVEIPSMVDPAEFDPAERDPVRAELGIPPDAPLIGWVGRLDRKKRVEDFLHAAALVRAAEPAARFVVVGGPDAFMPEYADELRGLAADLGLVTDPGGALQFLGARPDVPRLLAAFDVLAWLSRGEGMPHVIAEAGLAEGWHDAQYQAADLISGRFWPQVGGEPALLDIVGVNYDPGNHWIHGGPPIGPDHSLHRPLSDLLLELHARTGRPLLISETGTEGAARGPWLAMVAAEARRARARGVPLEGICLYPVANHLGWDDDRLCENGLLGHLPVGGTRSVDPQLLAVIRSDPLFGDADRPGQAVPAAATGGRSR